MVTITNESKLHTIFHRELEHKPECSRSFAANTG